MTKFAFFDFDDTLCRGDSVVPYLLYAIRNSQGQIVNDISTTMVWDDLWYSRRHANAIPLPAASGESSVPGAYTLEIYANGKLLAYINFSIA